MNSVITNLKILPGSHRAMTETDLNVLTPVVSSQIYFRDMAASRIEYARTYFGRVITQLLS